LVVRLSNTWWRLVFPPVGAFAVIVMVVLSIAVLIRGGAARVILP
jgi:hypothetical protein